MHHSAAHSDPTFAGKSRSTFEIVRRVAVYLRPYKGLAAANILFAILSLGASFMFPQLLEHVVDEVIVKKQLGKLTWLSVGLLGAFFGRDLFNSLRILVNNVFEQHVIFDMRREVYGKLQRLPVNYFDQRASGDLMTRVIEDVNSVERILIDGTEQGTVAVLGIVGVLTFLILKNPMLTAVALVPLPFLAVGVLWYTLTAHRRYRAQRQASAAMNALLMDNLQGVRQIKSFGRETHEDTRFEQRADDLRKGTLQVMKIWAIYSPAMTFAMALGTVCVVWYGGRCVIAGTLTPGQFTSFLFFLTLLYDPITKLHGLNQILQAARAAGERVFDILDHGAERPDPTRQAELPARVRGEIIYDHVSFAYAADRQILKSISLHAKPGEMIALVGPTGAGKSTLVNLLPAFYELTSGRISIDGQDTSRVALQSLRDQIAIVTQEAFLFNGTVRENILYGRLDATEEELIAAARAANCHEFIMRLSEGYDSRVGERGVKLSVGEKQRVSIARALLKNAPILILDEATASVDTATEKLIQEALERLMANRTSFVIAHRLSTVRKANQILVMQHGEIIERGTHDELFQQNGLYARLARIQNTTFIEEGFEKIVPVS
ncbi:MAG: transporter ATP-binding protein [Verrucomicrobiales bacterium]|nr:transporter ATP-binding protein [Verrucomicrobiales bacterium]